MDYKYIVSLLILVPLPLNRIDFKNIVGDRGGGRGERRQRRRGRGVRGGEILKMNLDLLVSLIRTRQSGSDKMDSKL